MVRLIPLFSMMFNFLFFFYFEKLASLLIPQKYLPFNDFSRSLILYVVVMFFLYTPSGQRVVAFFASGRNMIGREEKVLEPIIEHLKDRTDIRGYSAPVRVQFHILNALNNLTGRVIKPLNRRVNRIKYEYLTGTVKLFTYDSLDIESNSFGNSIFVSKGAVDTLSKGELTALLYNEFAQIKYNIANKRLLHQAGILLGRLSSVMIIILSPVALLMQLNYFGARVETGNSLGSNFLVVVLALILSIVRLFVWFQLWKNKINFTNLPYMLYERRIFIDADRATYKAGFSADILTYLEKLYVFKLEPKNYGKLFAELRPLVAYRINYFDNMLGNNRELSVNNYAWSSNYMERVQVLMNKKD